MTFIRSEVSRLFAIGFVVGTLMVGAATASNWNQEFAPQAFAAEQEVSAAAAE